MKNNIIKGVAILSVLVLMIPTVVLAKESSDTDASSDVSQVPSIRESAGVRADKTNPAYIDNASFVIDKSKSDEWMITDFVGGMEDVYIPSYVLVNNQSLKVNLANLDMFKNKGIINLTIEAVSDPLLGGETRKVGLDTIYVNSSFEREASIKILDLNGVDVSGVIQLASTFSQTYSIEKIYIDQWDTSSVEVFSETFWNDNEKSPLFDVRNWNTGSAKYMNGMFYGAQLISPIDNKEYSLSNWDVRNVIGMSNMFSYGFKADTLDLSAWNISSLLGTSNMFGESNIRHLDISTWNLENVSDTGRMFDSINNLVEFNVGKNVPLVSNFSIFDVVYNNNNQVDNTYRKEWLYNNEIIFKDAQDFATNFDNTKTGLYTRAQGSYKVSFNYNGTQTVVDAKFNELMDVNKIPNVISEGYMLTGWNTKSDGTGEWFDPLTAKVIGDMELFAQLETAKHDVNFESDGKVISSSKVEYNSYLDQSKVPSNPEKEGYTFIEWNTKSDGSGIVFDPSTQVITGDTTVYAKFKINSYTVTFNDEGVITNVSANYNTSLNPLEVPKNQEKQGYKFIGWNTQKDGQGEMFDVTNSLITRDMEVYAIYTKDEQKVDTIKPTSPTTGMMESTTLAATGLVISAIVLSVIVRKKKSKID